MPRERIYGSDTEFCQWLRHCSELPSVSKDFGFVANDNDITVHRYMHSVDGIGTRQVQGIMEIEVKTRSGYPNPSQLDTLVKKNRLCCRQIKENGQVVRGFGVFILSMSGTSPDNSEDMWWGIIPKKLIKSIKEVPAKKIDKHTLIELLRFDRHPRNFEKQAFRRHHKTSKIIKIQQCELGFEVEQLLIKKS